MNAIIVIVGESREQVVARALAACRCDEPENHRLLAQPLLAKVTPNDDGEPKWPFVLILEDDGDMAFDLNAEGVHHFTADTSPVQ